MPSLLAILLAQAGFYALGLVATGGGLWLPSWVW